MSLQSARVFLGKVKSDESFYNLLFQAKSKEERHRILSAEGFNFSHKDFERAKSELSDWDLTMLEDESSFRSDKRVSGLEFCCCCNIAGSVDKL